MNLVSDATRVQAVISKLEKDTTKESSKIVTMLKEVAKKVKDKAKEEVANIVLASIKTLGSIALGYFFIAIASS